MKPQLSSMSAARLKLNTPSFEVPPIMIESHSLISPLQSRTNELLGRPKELIKTSIIDDDDCDRLIMKRILGKAPGFTCASTHATANEALNRMPSVNPHLVCIDIRMPDMNGLECTRRLKSAMPQSKIIIVNWLLEPSAMDKSLAAGADAYLTKPVAATQCLATLKFAFHI